jgi:hypothetical protein
MNGKALPYTGAGLGLRRSFINELLNRKEPTPVDFWEVAPENWMEMGGVYGKNFAAACERFSVLCHGLSLSIGSPAPLDEHFVHRLKKFFDKYDISHYSEHLSYCSDDGHLYDLMPIPFTEEAVHHVAERVKRVQDILERELILENVSYYGAPGQEMAEVDFVNAVLEEANCGLLLDVNNVYVNSINHHYDADTFLAAMPTERIRYIHIAGHYNEAEDLIVDTHGAEVIDPVWDLLDKTYSLHGVVPTLLERDFNIPPLNELFQEVDQIHQHQKTFSTKAVSHG